MDPWQSAPSAAYVYVQVVAPLINDLLVGVMVIGLLATMASHVIEIMQRHRQSEGFRNVLLAEAPFIIKRLMMVLGLALFNAYLAISYDVWSQLEPPVLEQNMNFAKRLVLLVLPIDLIQVSIVAGMFGVLSVDGFWTSLSHSSHRPGGKAGPRSARFELGWLFFLTGLWHGALCVWWLLYASLSEIDQDVMSLQMHGGWALGHFLCFFFVFKLWRHPESRAEPPRRLVDRVRRRVRSVEGVVEWSMVFAYCVLIATFYAYRTGQHVEMAVSDNKVAVLSAFREPPVDGALNELYVSVMNDHSSPMIIGEVRFGARLMDILAFEEMVDGPDTLEHRAPHQYFVKLKDRVDKENRWTGVFKVRPKTYGAIADAVTVCFSILDGEGSKASLSEVPAEEVDTSEAEKSCRSYHLMETVRRPVPPSKP